MPRPRKPTAMLDPDVRLFLTMDLERDKQMLTCRNMERLLMRSERIIDGVTFLVLCHMDVPVIINVEVR